MPSPFPGMDPYLERPDLWPDVHMALILFMRLKLHTTLPERYSTSAEKYVWIHEPEAEQRTTVAPDVYVADHGTPVTVSRTGNSAIAPMQTVLPAVQREGNKYLKILDAASNRVVTVIEVLSPANKRPGPDRDAYLNKRIDYLVAGVNVVEIDLLRGGQRPPLGKALAPETDYYVMVCRASEMPAAGVWSFSVRDAIPSIPIPLLPDDADQAVDLKACLDQAYDNFRYDKHINYAGPADPALRAEDVAWAKALTAQRQP